jgi:hypothetical protein
MLETPFFKATYKPFNKKGNEIAVSALYIICIGVLQLLVNVMLRQDIVTTLPKQLSNQYKFMGNKYCFPLPECGNKGAQQYRFQDYHTHTVWQEYRKLGSRWES